MIAWRAAPTKLEIARQAGADHLIDRDKPTCAEKSAALGGADVVYDPVAGAQFARPSARRPEAPS